MNPEVLSWTEVPAVELRVYRGLYKRLDFILSYKLANTLTKVSIIIHLLMSSKNICKMKKYMLNPLPFLLEVYEYLPNQGPNIETHLFRRALSLCLNAFLNQDLVSEERTF